jgi:hypothetical protein
MVLIPAKQIKKDKFLLCASTTTASSIYISLTILLVLVPASSSFSFILVVLVVVVVFHDPRQWLTHGFSRHDSKGMQSSCLLFYIVTILSFTFTIRLSIFATIQVFRNDLNVHEIHEFISKKE